MGAVGALSTKLELAGASRPADKAPAEQRIQVLLVPNGGIKGGKSVFVPPASARASDTVTWVATTANIERIHKIAFKPLLPNPFSETEGEFVNSPSARDLGLPVLANAVGGHYRYTIWVKEEGGGQHWKDPDLDII
jgi:hypothetical protein